MDPIANIKEQREIAAAIIATFDGCGTKLPTPEQESELAYQGEELARLVQALDEWQLKGGFSPYVREALR